MSLASSADREFDQSNLGSHLWQAADILRRSWIDPSDWKNYLLPLFFFKRICDVWDDTRGDSRDGHRFSVPAGCHWNDVRGAATDVGAALANALRCIEQANEKHLRGVFGDASWSSRERLTDELLKDLLAHFSSLNLGSNSVSSNVIGDAYEYLIGGLADTTQRKAGEFYTPRNVVRLLVDMLGPCEGESVYDPACGTGGMLLAAVEHVAEAGGDPQTLSGRLYGQEVNYMTSSIARMNLLLHGIEGFSIELGDTLRNPKFIEGGALRTFDVVLANPPFSVDRWGQEVWHSDPWGRTFAGLPPAKSGDFAWLQHMVKSMAKPQGRLGILLPHAALLRGGENGRIRQKLLEADLVEAVVALAPNLFYGSGLAANVLLLRHNKEAVRKNKVCLIDASSLFDKGGTQNYLSPEHSEAILAWYQNFIDVSGICKVVSYTEIAEHGFALDPGRYTRAAEAVVARETILGGQVAWKTLAELVTNPTEDVVQGARLTPKGRDLKGDVPIIRGRDLTVPTLTLEDLATINPKELSTLPRYAAKGDILLQRIGRSPKAVMVDEKLKGALVGDTVYLVRLAQNNRHLGRYIVEFLNSAPGQTLLVQGMSGLSIPTLKLSELRNLSIPLPEKPIQRLVDDLHDVESRLVDRIEEARKIRQQLFGINDPLTATSQLQQLSVEAKVLSSSLLQLNDLRFQIRSAYPYPLAYAYRTLDAIPEPAQRYKAQLRVAENLLAFLGSVGLALTAHVNVLSSVHPSMGEYLKELWGKGISPGHWQSLAQRTAEALLAHKERALIGSFSTLWFRGKSTKPSDFSDLLAKIPTFKNAFKHDRGPDTTEGYKAASLELEALLNRLYKDVQFFIQHPIRLVQRVDSDRYSSKITLDTLVLRGDHPGLEQQRITFDRPLTVGDLYIELEEGDWANLYPFISMHICPNCQTQETYLVDAWKSGKSVHLKSFERGHSIEIKSGRGIAEADPSDMDEHFKQWLREHSG